MAGDTAVEARRGIMGAGGGRHRGQRRGRSRSSGAGGLMSAWGTALAASFLLLGPLSAPVRPIPVGREVGFSTGRLVPVRGEQWGRAAADVAGAGESGHWAPEKGPVRVAKQGTGSDDGRCARSPQEEASGNGHGGPPAPGTGAAESSGRDREASGDQSGGASATPPWSRAGGAGLLRAGPHRGTGGEGHADHRACVCGGPPHHPTREAWPGAA